MQGLLWEQLQRCLDQGVHQGVFCGAQAFWEVDGESGGCCSGTLCPEGQPVSMESRFDIASLTKLYTAACAFRLTDRGLLNLQAPLGTQVPSLPKGSAFRTFTVAQILSHETGLVAWRPWFEQIPNELRGTAAGYSALVSLVLAEAADATLKGIARYSDTGFVGLGDALCRITGRTLEALVADEVTMPLDLFETGFQKLSAPVSEGLSIARTEVCSWRGRMLEGEVHDDNAWTMGGVAGHAGLFATAREVCAFGTAWRLACEGAGWISADSARQAFRARPGGRTMGFDVKRPTGSAAGDAAGPGTVGHLGFTGTSLWIDPDRRAVIALLTNRVCPTRDNDRIRTFRPLFHNLFFQGISSGGTDGFGCLR